MEKTKNTSIRDTYIFIGNAILLVTTAGLINSIAILGIHGSSVAHVTGSASSLAIELSKGIFSYHLALLISTFLLGAFASGAFIGSVKFRKQNSYGVLLIIESFILVFGAFLYINEIEIGAYMFSFACGLQNAIVMTYRGSIIRTTHLTGIMTDFGSYLGNKARGVEVEAWRIYMNFFQIVGFLFGSFFGAYFFLEYGIIMIWLPAIACFSIGLSYHIWSHYFRKIIHLQ
ncbi:membrane protein [Leptospira kobayashii]|uniref:Membrane protein n=1 Tax=Leptospira kobayashii TaxID=1917830 RepID=A0ABM7UI61_9LEPT|nr:YoaK family protein [Leptospira kobayashii]BDA78410.1 membrane protein [Leptospira kobayashii]